MTSPQHTIRLLDLSFTDGARQLAITDAIMLAVAQGLAPPTLRLYSWSEPVVIIGVGQPIADIDLEACRNRGYRILRRIGGGTAVYHDSEEVSIDLIVPTGHRLGPTDVHAGYRQFARFLANGLKDVGVETETVEVEQARTMTSDPLMRPICFASISPYEFFKDGRKLDGICQIRRRDAIAYQAAIYNRFPVEPMIASIVHASNNECAERQSRLERFVTDMATINGRPVDYRKLQASLATSAEIVLDSCVEPGELSDFELTETERLITEKYGTDDWTCRR